MRKSKYKSDRDGYLLKKFGRSEEEYNKALAKQNGGCRVCGSTPKTRPLHLDHDHKIQNWKIISQKMSGTWYSWPDGHYPITALTADKSNRLCFMEWGRTKPEARAKVKVRLKRLSSRGVLCFGCNVGLKKFYDNAGRLQKAAAYLWEYENFLDGTLTETNGFGE